MWHLGRYLEANLALEPRPSRTALVALEQLRSVCQQLGLLTVSKQYALEAAKEQEELDPAPAAAREVRIGEEDAEEGEGELAVRFCDGDEQRGVPVLIHAIERRARIQHPTNIETVFVFLFDN